MRNRSYTTSAQYIESCLWAFALSMLFVGAFLGASVFAAVRGGR